MEVDLTPLSQSEQGKPPVTFGCNEFAPHSDAEEKFKDGGMPVASEEEDEEFDCPTRTHRRRRAIRRRLKTGPNSMSQAEKAMYQQILNEQVETEQGRPLQERAHDKGLVEHQEEWESCTIPASRACVSVSVSHVGEEEDEDGQMKSDLEQWAGCNIGRNRVGAPSSSSTQDRSNCFSPSSCVALPLASGKGLSVSFSPTRRPGPNSMRSSGSTGRWMTPNGSYRRAFVEPGPPEGDRGSESDWSGSEREEERHSRIASRRGTGPQQLSQEQIDEMNLLFAKKCS